MTNQNIILQISNTSDEIMIKDKKIFIELSAYINELILHNFEKLVSLLYRLDINENKIKWMLSETPAANASDTIAALIIERQLQKIKSRKENSRDINDISDDEKW